MLFAGAGDPNVSGDGDSDIEGEADQFLIREEDINEEDATNRARQFDSELNALDNLDVERVAIALNSPHDVVDGLNLIENVGGVIELIDVDALVGTLISEPIIGAELTSFDLLVNGVNINDAGGAYVVEEPDVNGSNIDGVIDINDVIATPFGYTFGVDDISGNRLIIGGLNDTLDSNNTIQAELGFSDGSTIFSDINNVEYVGGPVI